MRLPTHIGIIPDGNRRWAVNNGLTKDKGYDLGILPGTQVFKLCKENNIDEVTFYGFTVDNTKRPALQKHAFINACVKSIEIISKEDCEILVIGNSKSPAFPKELIPYTTRKKCGAGGIKINFLINYGWKWDLDSLHINNTYHSKDISRIDLIIRWGGRRRLSGFLPVQSVYSDFYIIEDLWPDFKKSHFTDALKWYASQDVTFGG